MFFQNKNISSNNYFVTNSYENYAVNNAYTTYVILPPPQKWALGAGFRHIALQYF